VVDLSIQEKGSVATINGAFFIFMRQNTKKQRELRERLGNYNLVPEQLEYIMAEFCKGMGSERRITTSIDQAIRYKNINEGKKIRDFMFIFKNDCHKKRGIYKVTFGSSGKFYIGSTKHIDIRFRKHKRDLRMFLKAGECPPKHFLLKVFNHLQEDKVTYYFIVELIEEAVTVSSLLGKEQKWLDKNIDNPKCLNINFTATRPETEIEETVEMDKARRENTGVARRGGRVIFYNKTKQKLYSETRNNFRKQNPVKKALADSMNWGIEEMVNDYSTLPTVYKFYYGDVFLIIKSKSLSGGIYQLQRMYGYYVAYEHKIHDEAGNYYALFYEHIKKNPDLKFRVEIILQSESAYDLLMAEQNALEEFHNSKKCRNSNVTAYINKFNENTGMYNWMPADDVDRFYESISKPSIK
jgi:hypothetical protein